MKPTLIIVNRLKAWLLLLTKSLVLIGPLMLTWPITSNAQNVYTWEDEDNVVHFNDNSLSKNSQKITLPDYQASAPAPEIEKQPASKAVPLPESSASQSSTASNKDTTRSGAPSDKPQPLALTLTTPKDEETIRSNRGVIQIHSQLNRKLGIGEQLQLMLNGNRYGAPQTKPQWTLKNIDRGSHMISIQAVRSGKLIASTTPITVYLHRATAK